MCLDFRDGCFRVTGCENGHVILEIIGEDGLVKAVCTMSVEEASVLSADLTVVAHEVSRHKGVFDETRHERWCEYVTAGGPASCTCGAAG